MAFCAGDQQHFKVMDPGALVASGSGRNGRHQQLSGGVNDGEKLALLTGEEAGGGAAFAFRNVLQSPPVGPREPARGDRASCLRNSTAVLVREGSFRRVESRDPLASCVPQCHRKQREWQLHLELSPMEGN